MKKLLILASLSFLNFNNASDRKCITDEPSASEWASHASELMEINPYRLEDQSETMAELLNSGYIDRNNNITEFGAKMRIEMPEYLKDLMLQMRSWRFNGSLYSKESDQASLKRVNTVYNKVVNKFFYLKKQMCYLNDLWHEQTCLICNKALRDKVNLETIRRQLQEKYNSQVKVVQFIQQQPIQQKSKYKCTSCNREFATLKGLNGHTTQRHQVANKKIKKR